MTGRLFTSESVTEGHPDKIADAISDTVLDYLLEHDPKKQELRVAVETLLTTGLVVVAGEVRTNAYAPVAELVRGKILEIGYDSSPRASTASPAASRSPSAASPPTSRRASTTATRRGSAPPRTRSTSRAPATRA